MPIPIAKEIFGFVVSKYNKNKKIKIIGMEGKTTQESQSKVQLKRERKKKAVLTRHEFCVLVALRYIKMH